MNRPKPNIVIQPTPSAAAQRLVEHMVSIIQQASLQWSNCHIALCGGTTPREAYRMLASQPLSEQVPWDKVQIYFGDERDVSPDHVENNYRMASNLLLDHVPIPLSHVHPMPTDCTDMAAAAEQYERTIRRLVPAQGDVPSFDLILLGMGGEGHTASLFPDTPALAEHEKLVMAQFVPVIGRNRMTFTFPLINAARHVIFFITGADKAQAVASVLSEDPEVRNAFPAARVCPTHGQLFFYLDAEAARNLH